MEIVENIKENTQEGVKYCRRCHRKLKDEESKRLGYGKICYSKINKRRCLYLFDIEVLNNEVINE